MQSNKHIHKLNN